MGLLHGEEGDGEDKCGERRVGRVWHRYKAVLVSGLISWATGIEQQEGTEGVIFIGSQGDRGHSCLLCFQSDSQGH